MKRRALWITVVGMFFVVFLMGTHVASADVSQWQYDTPVLSNGQGGDFTGQEAMVTVKGTVKKIEPIRGKKNSLQMQLKDDEGGSWVVYMGPKWFIENQKIKFAAGDKVEVRGKKTGGSIIASEISKDNMTMRIRNEEDGQAVWQCCFPYKERKD